MGREDGFAVAVVHGGADTPEPACWATVPLDSGIHAMRVFDLPENGQIPEDYFSTLAPSRRAFHRAHPDWIVPHPREEAAIDLSNLHPRRPSLGFQLPRLRVCVDYTLGERGGTRELTPQMLVLLPEHERFYLVYRHMFHTQYEPDTERSMRLRHDEGWYRPEASE